MSHPLVALAGSPDAEVLHDGPPPGVSWRHLATVLLLIVTLPLFAAAAVATLPVLLAVGGAELLRRLWLLRSSAARRPSC